MVVTDANQREKNLVVSRRDLLEQERAEKREETWKTLEEGQVHKGVVRSVKSFGAFVDIGGVDGLIHVGDMAWSRVSDAAEPAPARRRGRGQGPQDRPRDRRRSASASSSSCPARGTGSRRSITGAQTVPARSPASWTSAPSSSSSPAIEGLVHISELSPTRVRRVNDIVKAGQEVEVRILKIEYDDKKMSLSMLPTPAASSTAPKPEEVEEEEDDTPRPPRPEPKIPLKGGLGDRDPFMEKNRKPL